jgi:hypothetical protein
MLEAGRGRELAWERMAAQYPPLAPLGFQSDHRVNVDDLEDDPLHNWLSEHVSPSESALDEFVMKLCVLAGEWCGFEEVWCRRQGVSLTIEEKIELHRLIAEFLLEDDKEELCQG